jgi:hypothetical protein
MKWIKPVIVGLSGLIAVLLGISALMPSQVMTSRWVRVYGGTEAPLQAVRDLNSWASWNLLLEGAKDVRVQPLADTGAGGSIAWTDARGGRNRIAVTGQAPNGIAMDITLGDNRTFASGFSIEQRVADSTQVVWYIVEELRWYPWEKFYGMMAADIKAPLMQESLDRFKQQLATRRNP